MEHVHFIVHHNGRIFMKEKTKQNKITHTFTTREMTNVETQEKKTIQLIHIGMKHSESNARGVKRKMIKRGNWKRYKEAETYRKTGRKETNKQCQRPNERNTIHRENQ